MPDNDTEESLDLAIDVCAEFEKQTKLKTAALATTPHKEIALKTGLTLKDIKKWAGANALAQKLLLKIQKKK